MITIPVIYTILIIRY